MKITQIRNATLHIDFGGRRFLVDPYLADKEAYPGFAGTANSDRRNPLVDLTVPMSEILDVDAVIVAHLHQDHWDGKEARNLIPKGMLVFVQNEKDAAAIQAAGFSNTRVLTGNTTFDGITLVENTGTAWSRRGLCGYRGTGQSRKTCGRISRT